MILRLRELPWPVVAIVGLAVVGAGLWLGDRTSLVDAQRSTPDELAELVIDGTSGLRTAVLVDMLLAVGYVVLIGWLIVKLSSIESHDPRVPERQQVRATVAGAAIVGAGVADIVENTLLWLQLRRFDVSALESALEDAATPAVRAAAGLDAVATDLLQAMRIAGLVKWGLLTVTALILIDIGLRKVRAHTDYVEHVSTDRPAPDEVADWEPEAGGRRGVCLSGGGIRSASFSLGTMQALQSQGWLDDADYLAAVSGGGYLAAGWAVSNGRADVTPPDDPPAWAPHSPEERWFRSHSSYLVPDLWKGLEGVGRLLIGIVVNLVLVWAVLYVGARPVGWLIHELHPELRPAKPLTLPDDLESGFTIGDLNEVDAVETGDNGAEIEVRRFTVDIDSVFLGDGDPPAVDSLATTDNVVRLTVDPFGNDTVEVYPIEQVEPGLIELRQGVLTVVRDPEVRARQGTCEEEQQDAAAEERCRNVKALLRVTEQPELVADGRPVGAIPEIDEPTPVAELPVVRDRLAVGAARINRTEGPATRGELSFPRWMWISSLGLVGAGLLLGLAAMLGRQTGRLGRELRYASAVVLGAGLAWFAVLIALPWLLDELPDRVTALTKEGGEQYQRLRQELIIPAGGFLAFAFAAVSQYLRSNRAAAGKDRASWWKRLRKGADAHTEELKWYELSPSKILAGIALVVVPLFIVVGQLQYAVANGWDGRLVGFAWAQDWFPSWLEPEIVRWGVVVVALWIFATLVDAHAWSLHPFYKRRLQSAYLLDRVAAGTVEQRPYDLPIPFTPDLPSGWPGLRHQPPEVPPAVDGDVPDGPQLILCCAANLSEANRVPPGRRAASFTFSSDVIGGPVVGWANAQDYWAALSGARRRDITVPSAMSISGAAFSPAMGKKNLGPVGAILAMSNLRLGVWIPHPQYLPRATRQRSKLAGGEPEPGPGVERGLARWWATRRPGWPWFFKELTNSYPFQSPYLYVSDGGHWDNLGLVELLRRGCTEVLCVNAGGDGQAEFGTIAEAVALAREELGVEIELDPSDLRPPLTVEPGSTSSTGGRELRRKAAPKEVEPFAKRRFVTGTIRYPATADRDEVTGTLYLIEPALTADLPLDVHGFAESEAIFPDDSTADQVYNHRQFESFRRLGYHQAQAIFEDAPAERTRDAPA